MIKTIIPACLLLMFGAAGLAQAQEEQDARVDYPTCNRAELEAATAAYVEAQRNGDISDLPLAGNADYLENMIEIEKGDGLWNTALPIEYTASFHDPVRCKTFTEVIVTEGGHPYVIGTRLYMNEGEIIRVDSLVTDEGDWLFNATAYAKYAKTEDWTPLPISQRTRGQEMINGANAYLDKFADKHVEAPWGTPCERLEGGAYTNSEGATDTSCEVGIPPGVLYIVNRDYLVDEEKGVVNIFCRFGDSRTGMPDSHTFRYVDGKYRYVHTISTNLGDEPSPQADDDGNVIQN